MRLNVRKLDIKLDDESLYLAEASHPGTLLLAESLESEPGAKILVLGGGSGLLPIVARDALQGSEVTVLTSNVAMAESVDRAISLNPAPPEAGEGREMRVRQARSSKLIAASATENSEYDVALLTTTFAPGRFALEEDALLALRSLRPDGRLYLAGGKGEGIESLGKMAEKLGLLVSVESYRKGHRVLRATFPDDQKGYRSCQERIGAWLAERNETVGKLVEVELRGVSFSLESQPRVFADGLIDAGTRLLLESLPQDELRGKKTVADLGSGGGLIALALARLCPKWEIIALDSELAAVALTANNAERLGLGNIRAIASNALAALPENSLDLVITNPPFHLGRIQTTVVANRFVADSVKRLRPGGRLYLVANSFLRYETAIETAFGSVEVVGRSPGYKVLSAEKKAERRPERRQGRERVKGWPNGQPREEESRPASSPTRRDTRR